jgi:pyruvate/2-oxoglutarate dehydrogenase complex dihydrolipoamide dehydrogenase (E3) component
LVVIGAGVAGLLSVITGKWLGKKCALIESHAMGGDCLNIGCVPSKALIAASRALADVRNCSQFGINIPSGDITVDFGRVMQRMRQIRADISHHDSVERYSREFCEHVFVGKGQFSDDSPNTVLVTGDDGSTRSLRYKKAMIATGASATIPPELVGIPHLTNANFFNLTEMPPRMFVLGTGPIGLELAQAMSVFGCDVTCVSKYDRVLPKEDPTAAALILTQLQSDGERIDNFIILSFADPGPALPPIGVKFCLSSRIVSVTVRGAVGGAIETSCAQLYQGPWSTYTVTVHNDATNEDSVLECEAILNATGRTPNVFDVGLEHVSISYTCIYEISKRQDLMDFGSR